MADHDRIAVALKRFLGVEPTSIESIPAGLGTRRFFRVELPAEATSEADAEGSGPRQLIARVESDGDPKDAGSASPLPSPSEALWLPEPPLEPLRTYLESMALSVPRSYGHDSENGIDLLEDVGDRTLMDLKGAEQRAGYREAGDLIVRLQALDPAPAQRAELPSFSRIFDDALLQTKAWKLKHWGWPGILGRPPTDAEARAIDEGFAAIADCVRAAPKHLAHRDFKAENLHVVSRDGGPDRLVMIDLQGAFLAPPEYDAVCLLRDLQVELDEALVESVHHEILSRLPDAESADSFERRFDALTLVRLAKDISHLIDAAHRRGDRRRWHEIPRGLKLLRGAAERLQSTFPEIRALNNVIETLTQGSGPADIADQGRGE